MATVAAPSFIISIQATMLPDPRTRFALVVALVLALASFATQAQSIDHLASEIEDTISRLGPVGVPLEAAKTLFWSLAVISLVWTIGMHVLRQDIGEVLMELVRFSVVTGIFYWLLINASEENGGGGFIGDIVGTFFELGDGIGGASYRVHADAFVSQGLHTLFSAIKAAENADMSDQLLTGGIAILILVMLTIVAAQFLMALVMAWLLGYAGIFLLGFGGARWSSPLAISYYKHAVAMGIMLLVLGLVGKGGLDVFDKIGNIGMRRADSQYTLLGVQLAASVLLLVAGVRIPQFFYTMVTGSQLGMFAGAAGMIGSAIATGGGAAIAAATGHIATGGAGGGPGGRSSPGGARAESVMDAVLRSSAGTAGSDAFHVGSGTDPFGVPRSADGYRRGSVFGSVADVPGTATVTASDRATVRDERRDVPKTTRDEVSDAENAPRDAMHPNETGGTDPGSPPDYAAELDAIHRARDKAGNAPIVGDTLSETPPASAHFEHTGSNRLPTSAAAAAVPNMSAREDAPGMITGHDPSADTHRVDVRGAGFERVTDDTGTVGISEDRRQDMHAGDENPLASMPHVIRNGLAGDHAE
ncbi:MAG: P-type conjugative transfer protein TrbL, partial [Luteibacter sp.]